MSKTYQCPNCRLKILNGGSQPSQVYCSTCHTTMMVNPMAENKLKMRHIISFIWNIYTKEIPTRWIITLALVNSALTAGGSIFFGTTWWFMIVTSIFWIIASIFNLRWHQAEEIKQVMARLKGEDEWASKN